MKKAVGLILSYSGVFLLHPVFLQTSLPYFLNQSKVYVQILLGSLHIVGVTWFYGGEYGYFLGICSLGILLSFYLSKPSLLDILSFIFLLLCFLPGLENLFLGVIGGVTLLCVLPSCQESFCKKICLSIASGAFVYSFYLWTYFSPFTQHFQWGYQWSWFPSLGLTQDWGLDGLSVFLFLLTTFLFFLCTLSAWGSMNRNIRPYLICFLIMEVLLLAVFCTLDLMVFYICFEGILIPMYFVMGSWGSSKRRIHASTLFFFYTLGGSLAMLLSIFYMYVECGSTDYISLMNLNWSKTEEYYLWLGFFLSFASKLPMLPFHVWLPEAHVEAPTTASVLLAGILLKLGTYGFLRFSLGLFPWASLYFSPFLSSLAILGILYTSLTAIRQVDLKRIIAYTSVAHMNLVVLGMFSFTTSGIQGALLQSLSHGLVSSGLFLCIGVIYDRYHNRLLPYYGGLVQVMPLFVVCFLFFSLANMGLPGTSSFVGEFLLLIGIFHVNTLGCLLGGSGMVFSAIYVLWLANRMCYGNLNTHHMTEFHDLSPLDFVILGSLILCSLVMGVQPSWFLGPMEFSIQSSLQHLY